MERFTHFGDLLTKCKIEMIKNCSGFTEIDQTNFLQSMVTTKLATFNTSPDSSLTVTKLTEEFLVRLIFGRFLSDIT